MADAPAAGKGGKILGMPRTTGIIVLGLGALVVGYLVISRMSGGKSSGSGSGSGGGGGGAYGPPGGSVTTIITEWQGHGHHKGGGGGKKKDPGGPERQWLIRKTGSQHPWTYLAQHHERIIIGPHGSRTIVKGR